MTDLIDPAAAATHVLMPQWAAPTEMHPAVGERTRNLLPYIDHAPPRRPDATGEQPVYEPQTIGVVDPVILTGEILAEETATEVLFAAALEVADEPLVADVPDEDLVPGYAVGSDERPPPTLPTPPHPRPGGRRRAGGRAPLPTWMVVSLAAGAGWLLNLVTVLVILWQLTEASR